MSNPNRIYSCKNKRGRVILVVAPDIGEAAKICEQLGLVKQAANAAIKDYTGEYLAAHEHHGFKIPVSTGQLIMRTDRSTFEWDIY